MSKRSGHHRQARAAMALGLAIATIGICPLRSLAEVTFDRSVGPPALPPMTLNGAMNIPDSDGTQVGPNLFHSFSVFNIDPGESATFTSSFAGLTENVVARVTGNSASVFQGPLINTIGTSALWIFNPNGMAFTPTASISLNGALHVSSADYLLLSDGNRFGADLSNLDNTMLSMAPPVTFGFLGTPGTGVSVTGMNLQVDPGETVSLTGDTVSITNSNVVAPGGRINVAGISSGEATLTPTGITVSANAVPAGIDLNASTLNTDGPGGGSIYIRGGQFMVQTGSSLTAETNGSVDGQTIDIDVSALSLGDSTISTDSNSSGSIDKGDGGSIRIANAQTVLLSNSEISSSSTQDGGDAGALSILDVGMLTLDNSTIKAETVLGGAGGSIDITSDSVLLNNESAISVSSSVNTSAPAGTITIGADTRIDIMDSCTAGMADCSGITASSGGGLAGGIVIVTPEMNISGRVEAVTEFSGQGTSLFMIDADRLTVGGTISTRTDGVANAGSMQIISQDMTVDGGQITSSTTNEGFGGDITINAGSLTVTNGGELVSSTDGPGDAGTISIDAAGTIAVSGGSRIASDANDSGSFIKGNGGAVLISNAQTVSLDNGEISSNANPNGGDAGELRFENIGTMTLTNNSAITARTTLGGQGGSIFINPVNVLTLSNGSEISVSSSVNTSAQAGTINITATDMIDVTDGTSSIEASSGGGLAGGVIIDTPLLNVMGTIEAITQFSGQGTTNFAIDADTLTVGNGGSISTSTSGVANAGSMQITATDLLTIDGGQISSSTSNEGFGGTITITAGDVVVQSGGLISSASLTSASGAAGGVTVSTRDLTLTDGSRIIATTGSDIQAIDPAFIDVNATGDVVIDGAALTGGVFDTDSNADIIRSGISVSTSRGSNAGMITVDAANLTITRGGEISAATRGAGNAGEVISTVVGNTDLSQTLEDATGQVIVSRIESSSRTGTSGAAGNVTVMTDNLSLFDGAQIAASTESNEMMNSEASISVNASGDITIDGAAIDLAGAFVRDTMQQGEDVLRSGIVATTDGASSAGGITVTADNLSMTRGGEISASTRGPGSAGQVVSTVTGLTSLSGNVEDVNNVVIVSRIESASRTGDSGAAGSIMATTGDLMLSDGGRIAATTESNTPVTTPASIMLNASGSVTATGAVRDAAGTIRLNESGDRLRSGIIASTRGSSAAGDITITVAGNTDFSDLSVIESASRTGGSGSAGSIDLTSTDLTLTGGASVLASTESDTTANEDASVTVTANGNLVIDGAAVDAAGAFLRDSVQQGEDIFRSGIVATTDGASNAGGISVSAANLTMTNGGEISASTRGAGSAGAVVTNVGSLTSLSGTLEDVNNVVIVSRIESASRTGDSGAAGSIMATTGDLMLSDGGRIAATTESNTPVTTPASIMLNASGSVTATGAVRDAAGTIRLNESGDRLRSGIIASTRGSSAAGDITITVTGNTDFSDLSVIESASRTGGSGSAGSIDLTSTDLTLTGGASVLASTESDTTANEDASVTVTANGNLVIDGAAVDAAGAFLRDSVQQGEDIFRSGIVATTDGASNAGGISVSAANLTMTNGGEISASTRGAGNAGAVVSAVTGLTSLSGNVEDVNDVVIVSRIESASRTGTSGRAGSITLNTGDLVLSDGGRVAATTESDTPAIPPASITLDVSGNVTATGAVRDATGTIRLNESGDELRSGILASTRGESAAGDISLTAIGGVTLSDLGVIESASRTGNSGSAGNIAVSAASLALSGGAGMVASTESNTDTNTPASITANAGTISLDGAAFAPNGEFATDPFGEIERSTINVVTRGNSRAGGITLTTATLTVSDGASVSASTLGGGNAGAIVIDASSAIGITGALTDVAGTVAASRIESASRTINSGAAGSIMVDTGQLDLRGGGQIAATTASDLDNAAATITVNAGGDLTSVGAVLDAAGQVLPDSNGNAQRSGIVASTRGRSDAGAITLDVGGAMTLDERSYIESASRTSASGRAGSITIDAADITIINGAGIVASTESNEVSNAPAEITLTADSLSMDGVARDANGNLIGTAFDFERSTITTVTAGDSDAGGITVTTGSGIALTGGADISASTSSGGDAGAIDLLAPAGLTVSGGALGSAGNLVVSRIDSASRTSNSGAPGDIMLRTATLTLADGGQIAASTQSNRVANIPAFIRILDADTISISGTSDAIGSVLATGRRNQTGDFRSGLSVATDGASNAGDISLGNGASLLIADGGAIVASSTAAGAGGSITGSLATVTLRNGGQILASTAGSGNGGSIDLVALGPFMMVGGAGDAFGTGLETSSTSTAPDSGIGGSIDLRAGDLLLDVGARISATSLGGGNAGTISVVADKTLGLFAGSSIETISNVSAGGNIAVAAGEQLYMIDSSITASAFGVTATDNGGNVAIERPFFFILNNSDILAQANAGNGGNIDIAGDFVFQSTDSTIDASSNAGLDGVVTIDSPNDVTGSVIDLQIPVVDVSGLLRQRCLPDELRDRSSFIDEGRGGVRRAPAEYSNAPVDNYIKALGRPVESGAGGAITLLIPVAHLSCSAPHQEP